MAHNNITWGHHEKRYPFAENIGASGQIEKNINLKEKKFLSYIVE